MLRAELTADDTRQLANLVKGKEATVVVDDDRKLTIRVPGSHLMVEITMTQD